MEDQNNQAEQPESEQTQPAAPPPPAKSRMGVFIAILVLIAVGIAAYYVVSKKKAWNPESYLPKEAAAAFTIDLSSTPDKTAGRDFVVAILEEAGVKEPANQLFELIRKELKIDVERDVLPRLNGRGGLAIGTEMIGHMPGITAVVGANSDADALKLVELIKRKLTEQKTRFKQLKHGGFDYLAVSDGYGSTFCIGGVGSGVVLTLGEDSFKKSVVIFKGKPNLGDNEYYAKYRVCSDSTFCTFFYSGPGFYKLIGPMLGMVAAGVSPGAPEKLKKAIESCTAAVVTAQMTGDGVSVTSKALGSEEIGKIAGFSIKEEAAKLPADTAVAFCIRDAGALWKQYKKQLSMMPGPVNPLPQAAEESKRALGIDVFTEVIDQMESASLYWRLPGGPLPQNGLAGYVALVLGLDDSGRVASALTKMHAAAGGLTGAPIKSVLVDGKKFAVGLLDKSGIRFADALVGKRLMLLVTGADPERAAKSVLAAADGKISNLAASKGFAAVSGRVPSEAAAFMYCDVGKIFEAYKSMIEPARNRDIALKVTRKVGVVAATTTVSGKESENLLFIPFLR